METKMNNSLTTKAPSITADIASRGTVNKRIVIVLALSVLTGTAGYRFKRSLSNQQLVQPGSSATQTVRVQINDVHLLSDRFTHETSDYFREFESRNREAAVRAVERFQTLMNGHANGIDPFIKELNGFWTRVGMVGCTIKDHTWGKGDLVNSWVSAMFAHHVISDAAVKADIAKCLEQFQADVEANRNILYSQVQLSLNKIRTDLHLPQVDFSKVLSLATSDLQNRLQAMGDGTASMSVTSMLGGWVVGDVAQQVAVGILERVAITIGARLISGGTAGTAAAAGGSGGSFFGPAGTAVGIIAGLAAGWAFDSWLEAKHNAATRATCLEIIHRVSTDASNELTNALNQAANEIATLQMQSLVKAVEETK